MDKRYEDESLGDISSFLRELAKSNEYRLPSPTSLTIDGQSVVYKLGEIAERIDAASKRDAQRIERFATQSSTTRRCMFMLRTTTQSAKSRSVP